MGRAYAAVDAPQARGCAFLALEAAASRRFCHRLILLASVFLCSATTFSIVQSFVKTSHALRKTFLISLLQPAPEVEAAGGGGPRWLGCKTRQDQVCDLHPHPTLQVVHLFDDILLLTDGRVVYHGPVPGILPFFEGALRFECPPRKDMGSFLQEVTTPVGSYAYAAPDLLQARGLTPQDRDPMKVGGAGAGGVAGGSLWLLCATKLTPPASCGPALLAAAVVQLITSPPSHPLTSVEEMEAAFWKHTEVGREATTTDLRATLALAAAVTEGSRIQC